MIYKIAPPLKSDEGQERFLRNPTVNILLGFAKNALPNLLKLTTLDVTFTPLKKRSCKGFHSVTNAVLDPIYHIA
jgi:hypothetical protein